MSSRRTVILIVAVVVGALAAFGILNYVRGLEDSVYAGTELSEVWVVQEPIPKGTTAERVIQENLIAKAELPVDFRPATAIVDPQAELAGLVAVTDLPANATLVAGNFVSPAVVATGVTDRLEEKGMVTVTFSVDQIGGAAYMIEPGDYVNILTRLGLNELEGDEEGEEGETEPDIIITEEGTDRSNVLVYATDARYVYQKAEVLAIDKALPSDLGEASADGAAAPAGNSGMITLAVPPVAVQELLAIGLDSLYLSLVPASYEPVPLPPLDLGRDVLPGENEAELTPYFAIEEEPVE